MTTAVGVERATYKGWDAWKLISGPLELAVVPQVGGRIMGISWRGHDLSFAQPEREGQIENVAAVSNVRARKREMGFPLWGGDKTWTGPQDRWTDAVPFLDLDSGPYEFCVEREDRESTIIRMISPVCRETGVQIERFVHVSSRAPMWVVTHRLRNASPSTVEWALWDVTMVRRPGQVYLPTNPSSQYSDGVKTFAHEGESVGVRDSVVRKLESLRIIACDAPRAFKFGVDAPEGWMLGVLEVSPGTLVGYRKSVTVHDGKPYPHDCTAEVYNSDRYSYFEMEILGPMVRLRPGEEFELDEYQTLIDVARWPQSEAEVREYLERQP